MIPCRYYDEETGREFYYNSFSNESTYDRPASYVDPAEEDYTTPGPVETGDEHWSKCVGFARLSACEGELPILLNDQRSCSRLLACRYYDENSKTEFYFNSATNESTYDRPHNFVTPRDPYVEDKAAAYYEEDNKDAAYNGGAVADGAAYDYNSNYDDGYGGSGGADAWYNEK